MFRTAPVALLAVATMSFLPWSPADAHADDGTAQDGAATIAAGEEHHDHRLALARVYLDLDRSEEAALQLREVMERPAGTPTDPLHKQEAKELLGDLPEGAAFGPQERSARR